MELTHKRRYTVSRNGGVGTGGLVEPLEGKENSKWSLFAIS